MVKTSLDIPEDLWRRVRHRAIDEHAKMRDILVRALEDYLKKPLPKKPAETRRPKP
jgi:hypothetical protein